MKPLTIGKLRGLQQISSERGTVTALAKPYTDFYTADAPFDWYKIY